MYNNPFTTTYLNELSPNGVWKTNISCVIDLHVISLRVISLHADMNLTGKDGDAGGRTNTIRKLYIVPSKQNQT